MEPQEVNFLESSMKKINFDNIRFLFSICIIAIHTYPFASINPFIDYALTRVLFRICVPIFLMITGYYVLSLGLDKKECLTNYTKKIGILYAFSIGIYLPITIINGHFIKLTLLERIKEILFTGTMYHLWYFPALILGIWIVYLLLKKVSEKSAFAIILFFYILGLLGDSYYGIALKIPGLEIIYQGVFSIFGYARNGIFYAPLFLYLGYRIKQRGCLLEKKMHLFLMSLSFIFLLLEGMLLLFLKIPRHNSMYVYLPVTAYFLFTLILQYGKGENRKFRKWSLWIYLFHPLSIVIINKCFHLCSFSIEKYHFLNFICVFLVTFLFVIFIEWGKEKMKYIFAKKTV